MPELQKIPPQNIEAEASLLGAVLIDPEAIIKINDLVSEDDFYRPSHAEIYKAMRELFEVRSPIDLVTLTDNLESKGRLADIGGVSFLSSLAESLPTSAHVVQYAQIIRQKATLRRLLSASSKVAELAYHEEADLQKILDEAEQAVFSVSQKHLSQNFIQIREILNDSFERIEEIHKNKGQIRGVPTGYKELDNILGGMQRSDLIILAARPSMGKSSLALNMAQYAAVHEGIPVGVFSLEMSKEQLVDRLLCGEAELDAWKLRTGNLSDDDFPKIGHAMGILSEAPIYIDDSPMLTVSEIRTKARRLQAEHGLGLIVLDYLQLMQGGGSDESRVQEISQISRSLKGLARELNIPVLALSQLSRAVEARTPHIPMLSDLRESGSIEQDADVVIFIYREDYYDKDSARKNIADILIRKHRNGPIGQVELYFAGEQTKFRDLEKRHTDEEIIF